MRERDEQSPQARSQFLSTHRTVHPARAQRASRPSAPPRIERGAQGAIPHVRPVNELMFEMLEDPGITSLESLASV